MSTFFHEHRLIFLASSSSSKRTAAVRKRKLARQAKNKPAPKTKPKVLKPGSKTQGVGGKGVSRTPNNRPTVKRGTKEFAAPAPTRNVTTPGTKTPQNPFGFNFSTGREAPSKKQLNPFEEFKQNQTRITQLENISQSRQLRGEEGSELARLKAQQGKIAKQTEPVDIVRSEEELEEFRGIFPDAVLEKGLAQLKRGALGVRLSGFSDEDTGQAGGIGRPGETDEEVRRRTKVRDDVDRISFASGKGLLTQKELEEFARLRQEGGSDFADKQLELFGVNRGDKSNDLALTFIEAGITGGHGGESFGRNFINLNESQFNKLKELGVPVSNDAGDGVLVEGNFDRVSGKKGFRFYLPEDDFFQRVAQLQGIMSGEAAEKQFQEQVQQQKAVESDKLATGLGQENLSGQIDPNATPTGAASNILGQLSPELQNFYGLALQNIQSQGGFLQDQFADDAAFAENIHSRVRDVASNQMERAEDLFELGQGYLRQNAEQGRILADQTRTRELAENTTQEQLFRIQANKKTRDLEGAHARRIQSMTNRVAIAGGFGSMNAIAAIEEADFDGEMEIADFVKEMGIVGQQFFNNVLRIEENYTRTMVGINRDLANGNISLVSKYNESMKDIEDRLLGSEEKREQLRLEAKRNLRSGWIKLQNDTINLIGQATTEVRNERIRMQKQQQDGRKQLWDNAFEYIDTFGTENKQVLANFESSLGLQPGSLSAQQTLAERRLRGAGGGGAQVEVANWLATTADRIAQGSQFSTEEEQLMMLLQAAEERWPGTSIANQRKKNSIYDIVNGELGTNLTPGEVENTMFRATGIKDLQKGKGLGRFAIKLRQEIMNTSNLDKGAERAWLQSYQVFGDKQRATDFVVNDVLGGIRPETGQPFASVDVDAGIFEESFGAVRGVFRGLGKFVGAVPQEEPAFRQRFDVTQ